VWIIGFRASRPFVAYLQWQLMQVLEKIVARPREPGCGDPQPASGSASPVLPGLL
jgi:hypothetical protein